MSKSVLLLLGSPRKNGNSDLIATSFAQGAESVGHITEKIDIQKKHISPCYACYSCRNSKTCVQKDDMREILEKMIKADVIVLATPVYFYSLSSQLKILIDRTLPRYMEIANKDFYFIATAAAGKSAIERTMDALRGFTDCLPNANIKGYIYGVGLYEKGDIKQTVYMQSAFEMGTNVQ